MHRLLLSYWAAQAPDLQIEEVTVPPMRMADAVSDGGPGEGAAACEGGGAGEGGGGVAEPSHVDG